jgi:hypothetical protein
MNTLIMSDDVLEVIKSFLSCNSEDEATECLVLSIGAELLDVSVDKLLEMLNE